MISLFWICFNFLQLREYVDDTEDYINIMLDDKQNHLLQMGVMLTTATLVVSAFVVVAGIFGMNINIELFDEKKAGMPEFLWTIGGGATGSLFLYVVAIAWGKHKQLLEWTERFVNILTCNSIWQIKKQDKVNFTMTYSVLYNKCIRFSEIIIELENVYFSSTMFWWMVSSDGIHFSCYTDTVWQDSTFCKFVTAWKGEKMSTISEAKPFLLNGGHLW